MTRRGKAKLFVSALLVLLILGMVFLGLLLSENRQWYALGRTYLAVSRLWDEEARIKEGSAGFSLSLTYENESVEGTGRFFFRRPETFRVEMESSAGSYCVVNNGSTWIHFKDRNAVLVADERLDLAEAARLIHRFVLAGASQQAKKGPLDLTSFVESHLPELKAYDVRYGGRETIGDSARCFKIDVKAEDPNADFASATVWIDPSVWLPRKLFLEGVVNGTVELFEVTLGSVEDEAFTFRMPEGAQVQRIPRETLLQLGQWIESEQDA